MFTCDSVKLTKIILLIFGICFMIGIKSMLKGGKWVFSIGKTDAMILQLIYWKYKGNWMFFLMRVYILSKGPVTIFDPFVMDTTQGVCQRIEAFRNGNLIN